MFPVHSRTLSSGNRGFTLVELLVAIAIISLLAAILFPVFATARAKARQAACLANMKQLGLAFHQYGDDNDDTLPCTYAWFNGCEGTNWAANIYTYVKNSGVYACPQDASTIQGLTVPAGYTRLSYIYNEELTHYSGGGTQPGGHEPQMAAPSSTVLLFEVGRCAINLTDPQGLDCDKPDGTGVWQLGSPIGDGFFQTMLYSRVAGFSDCISPLVPTGPSFGQRSNAFPINDPQGRGSVQVFSQTPRHTQGINFLAVDGHAKWALPDAVSTGIDPTDPNHAQGYKPSCYGVPWCAAGTNNMTLPNGQKAVLTMSAY